MFDKTLTLWPHPANLKGQASKIAEQSFVTWRLIYQGKINMTHYNNKLIAT